MNITDILMSEPRIETAAYDWTRLTAGSTLFDLCCRAVPDRERVEVLATSVEKWCNYVDTLRSDAPYRWQRERVRALATCMRKAVQEPNVFDGEVDRLGQHLSSGRRRWAPEDAWKWVCVRTLRKAVVRGRAVKVSVAGRNERPDVPAGGALHSLHLEVLDSGADVVAQDPVDACAYSTDADFEASMQDAWDAALALVRSEVVAFPQVDGRWRMSGGRPESLLSGRSASAAAARGWYHALRQTVADEHVIVVAQVRRRPHDGVGEDGQTDDTFEVAPVDRAGIAPKVRAIVAVAPRFDTIVVAGDNLDDARPHAGAITVVPLG